MHGRRQFLAAATAAVAGIPLLDWASRPHVEEGKFAVRMSEADWRMRLTDAEFHVLRSHGTERAFSSALLAEKRRGIYQCRGCGQPLFSSDTRYDSRTGWPSFWAPLDGAVGTSADYRWLMIRTEVHCARCGSHLGHVFTDGPRPTGRRYCINGVALAFVPEGGLGVGREEGG